MSKKTQGTLTTERLYRQKKVRDMLMQAQTPKSAKSLQKALGIADLKKPQKALQRILEDMKLYGCKIQYFRKNGETFYKLIEVGELMRLDDETASDDHKIQHLKDILGQDKLQELRKERVIQLEQDLESVSLEPNAQAILQAIQNGDNLSFLYQKLTDAAPIKRVVSPYLLKEVRKEWYLVAAELERDGEEWGKGGWLKFYGLSKITDVQLDKCFAYAENAEIYSHERFKHCYGAFINEEEGSIEEVILAFAPAYEKHLKDKPMHPTQEVFPSQAGKFCIKLQLHLGHYGLGVPEYNQQLLQDLASFGGQVQVIEPPHLADALKEYLRQALAQYPDL